MSFKIGDAVEVLHFEEGLADAPSSYIGRIGNVTSLTRTDSGRSRNIEVTFDEPERGLNNYWDFSPEQLKLVETI